MSVHRDMIVNLLHNLGSRREVSRYLDEFGGTLDAPPVVIKVGGAIIDERLAELASAVACLGHVGVRPIVVHGAGPQISRALQRSGIEPEFIDGRRVTTPQTLEIVRRSFAEANEKLVVQIERHGVAARSIGQGVFSARASERAALGRVGDVSGVDADLITAARDAGAVPVVSPFAHDDAGEGLNVNADIAARELAVAVGAQKVVFLSGTGGLLDQDGRLVPALTLADDFDALMSEPWVHGGMRLKLEEIKALLDRLPADASAAITSPEHLASELFTYRGAGTLVRRGFEITEHADAESLDARRLERLVSRSFARPLREGYLERAALKRVFVAGDYAAAAVITSGEPVAYLDKFAVTNEARGQGLAGSLWKRVAAAEPALFWRSRTGNEINPWYTSRADGMQRAGEWVVFWRGVRAPADIARGVRHALSQKDAFAASAPARKENAVAV